MKARRTCSVSETAQARSASKRRLCRLRCPWRSGRPSKHRRTLKNSRVGGTVLLLLWYCCAAAIVLLGGTILCSKAPAVQSAATPRRLTARWRRGKCCRRRRPRHNVLLGGARRRARAQLRVVKFRRCERSSLRQMPWCQTTHKSAATMARWRSAPRSRHRQTRHSTLPRGATRCRAQLRIIATRARRRTRAQLRDDGTRARRRHKSAATRRRRMARWRSAPRSRRQRQAHQRAFARTLERPCGHTSTPLPRARLLQDTAAAIQRAQLRTDARGAAVRNTASAMQRRQLRANAPGASALPRGVYHSNNARRTALLRCSGANAPGAAALPRGVYRLNNARKLLRCRGTTGSVPSGLPHLSPQTDRRVAHCQLVSCSCPEPVLPSC